MTYEQQALLYLVRLGIGNGTESGFDFAGVDWRNLVDSSFTQGVPAIAVDGLQKLYESNPSLELALDKPELGGESTSGSAVALRQRIATSGSGRCWVLWPMRGRRKVSRRCC